MRIGVYFWKPVGISEHKSLGNTVVDGGEWSAILHPPPSRPPPKKKIQAGVEPPFGLDYCTAIRNPLSLPVKRYRPASRPTKNKIKDTTTGRVRGLSSKAHLLFQSLKSQITSPSPRSGNDRFFRSTLPSNKQRSCQMEKVRSVAVYGTVSCSRECS